MHSITVEIAWHILVSILYMEVAGLRTCIDQTVRNNLFLKQRRINVDAASCSLYNVSLTRMQRHDVATTLMRLCINVICALGRADLRPDSSAKLYCNKT